MQRTSHQPANATTQVATRVFLPAAVSVAVLLASNSAVAQLSTVQNFSSSISNTVNIDATKYDDSACFTGSFGQCIYYPRANEVTSTTRYYNINRFDSNTGVLISAKIDTTANAAFQTAVSGSGTMRAQNVSVVGRYYVGGSAVRTTAFVSGSSERTNASLVGSGTRNTTYTFTPGSEFIGTNSYALRTDLSSTGIMTSSSKNPVTVSGSATVNYTISYNYLSHANASFSSIADVNEKQLDLTQGQQTFDFFALGSASTTTLLDYASMTCSGNCSAFAVSLTGQNIQGGSAVSALANFLSPAAAGNYQATYSLVFSDDDAVGVASTRRTNTLTLNLMASVSPVPEPATYAMMLAGLALVSLRATRKQPKASTRKSRLH